MNEIKCAECGSELIFSYETPTKYYCLNEENRFVRCDNNQALLGTDDPQLNVICSSDCEHDVGDSPELVDWEMRATQEFRDQGAYDL